MRKLKWLLLLVMTLSFVVGCTNEDDYLKKTYKSLKSAEIAYDTGMKVAADAHKKGVINDAQKEEVIKVADKFHASFMVASAALEMAVEMKDSSQTAQGRIAKAVEEMWLNYDTYKALMETLITSFKMPEVSK